MGALAGGLGGAGGASLQASSSASAGPQAGSTGNLVLNFGGINLGNQDIPLSATSANAQNQAPTVGNTPSAVLSGLTGFASGSYGPLLLVGGAAALLWYFTRRKA